jgi:dienelactone hydrolase
LAVQAGEGTEDIIYGSTSVPGGPRTFGGYLARPDGQHEWPTILVYGPEPTPSSTIKNICRVFARHGIAALAPALAGDENEDRRIGRAIAAFIAAPNGDWSNAQHGFGIVAFEDGIGAGARLAATDDLVVAFASIGSTLGDDVIADLAAADIPGLFVGSRGDDEVDIDASLAARDRIDRMTFAIYPNGDHGFWNDAAEGFRTDRFDDAMDRTIAFMARELPVRL